MMGRTVRLGCIEGDGKTGKSGMLFTPRRGWLVALLNCALVGCASVPPAPAQAQRSFPTDAKVSSGEQTEDGWLWPLLTGKNNAGRNVPSAAQPSPTATDPSAAAPVATSWPSSDAAGANSVRQASAVMPALSEAAPRASIASGGAPSRQVYPPPAPESPPPTKKTSSFEPDDLAPENIFKSLKNTVGLGPDEKIARKAFQEGEQLFAAKKYREAAEKFKTAAARWPDSLLEEDAMFMLGESYFFSDQYAKAHDTYGELLKKYDNSRYLDTVVKREFAIGRYWEQSDAKNRVWPFVPNLTDRTRPWFDTFGHSIDAYQRVQLHDPTGPLADDAWMAAGNAYFVRGKYEDAAWQYDRIRRDFAQSKHQKEAHLLGLKSKQLVYDGADYDGTPLADADEIARQTLTQFGRELGKEKEHVLKASKEIAENKALRDYAMGEYYEKKFYYGAARYYYQSVIRDYPLTQTAARAKQRYEAIRDKPDVPKNHFQWLTRLLGDPE